MQATDEPPSSPAPAWKRRFLESRLFIRVGDERRFVLNVERFVIFAGLLVFSVGIVATAAVTLGAFRFAAPVLLLIVLGFVGLLVWGLVTRNVIFRGDRFDAIALVVVLVSVVLAGILNHQAYLGTSDTGFYANDAIHMAKTGGRVFDRPEDALLHGMEPAPGGGVSYAAMFGYSSFIALFYRVGGLAALSWANAPFILIAHLGLYTVGRQLRARSGALIGLAFYSTSLVTMWLERYHMTEVAATAVFWVLAVLVVPLAHKWDGPRAAAALVPLVYGSVVRPEGILLLAWTVGLVALRFRHLFADRARTFTHRLRTQRSVQLATGFFSIIAILAVFQGRVSLPLGYLQRGARFASIVFSGRPAPDAHDVPTTGLGPNWGDYALRYVWDSWLAYYLPWFILVIVGAVLLRLVPRRRMAWLLALAIPYAFFFLMPPVTVQQPWFMRRYWVALVPLVYLAAGVSFDYRNAIRRWPVVRRKGNRPRHDAGIVAALVALVLVAPHLDVVSPVLARQESDPTVDMAIAMSDIVPHDAVVILDENAAGFATLARVETGLTVVPWRAQAQASIEAALRLSEGRPAYLVHGYVDHPTVLRPDANGILSTTNVTVTTEGIPGTPLRSYLANPPLREGYLPLDLYLDAVVPPDRWSSRLSIWRVETLQTPVVLQKNVELDKNWTRTADGLHADANASVLIDRQLFSAEALGERRLGLLVAYVQGGGDVILDGMTATESTQLAVLPSDRTGNVAVRVVPLPAPLEFDAVRFSAGVVIRTAALELI